MIEAQAKRVAGGGFGVFREVHGLRSRRRLELLDLTERIVGCVERSGIQEGLVCVQTLHTTTGILVNENEPLLLEDLREFFERCAPEGGGYRHDDLERRGGDLPPDERRNGDAHLRACLLRASETLHVAGGRLLLGRWQSVFLVELDGERDRSVSLLVLGQSGQLRSTKVASRLRWGSGSATNSTPIA